jgi:hypothetical protein
MCFMSPPVPQQPAPPVNTPDYTPDQSEQGVQMSVEAAPPVAAPPPPASTPVPKKALGNSRSGLKL